MAPYWAGGEKYLLGSKLSLWEGHYHFRLASVHYTKSTNKSEPPPFFFGNTKIREAPVFEIVPLIC